MRLQIVVNPRYSRAEQLLAAAKHREDLLLDLIEGALQFQQRTGSATREANNLRGLLEMSGSAYTVSDDDKHLVDVVSEEAEEIKTKATSQADEASEELSTAWIAAYGRSPDPSDAWDHAIKAVEAVLRPIVEPKNSKATLGSMIAVLTNGASNWRCVFPGKDDDGSVDNFVAMLRLIWPNTDRHGGGGRTPTLEEARAVVTLAATIVQWHREGTLLAPR